MNREARFARMNHSSRTPLIVSTATLWVVAIVTACVSRGDKKKVDTTTSSTASAVVTPAVVSGEVDSMIPTPTVVTFASAQTDYAQRKYGDAEQAFSAYVTRHPRNTYGHYMLGLSAWKNGDLDQARDAFEESLALDSTNVKTLLNLSRVLLDRGEPDQALERIEAAVALDSGSAEVYRVRGRVESALGKRDSAEVSYRLALSIDPSDSWSMNNLGLLLIDEGRYEDALMPLALATQLRPESPTFANNLGVALERTGHPYSASLAYRSALKADSTYEKAQTSLGRVDGSMDESPIDVAQLAQQFKQDLQTSSQVRLSAKVVKSEP